MDPLLTWFSRKQGAGEVGTVNAFKLGFAHLALRYAGSAVRSLSGSRICSLGAALLSSPAHRVAGKRGSSYPQASPCICFSGAVLPVRRLGLSRHSLLRHPTPPLRLGVGRRAGRSCCAVRHTWAPHISTHWVPHGGQSQRGNGCSQDPFAFLNGARRSVADRRVGCAARPTLSTVSSALPGVQLHLIAWMGGRSACP